MLARIVNKVVKVFKPPYKIHDIPALLGILLLFLIIPLITLNLANIGSQKAKAAAIPCPALGNFGDVDGINGVTTADARMISMIDGGAIKPTPTQKKNADVNGDGVVGITDVQLVLMYIEGSPIQVTFKACAENDGDGFSNVRENYLGTNPYKSCGTNAWPPDINNDRKVDIRDMASFITPIRRLDTKKGDKNFSQRFDLDSDGSITIEGDIGGNGYPNGILFKYWNKTCQIIYQPSTVPSVTFTGNGSTSPTVIAGNSLVLSWSTTPSYSFTKPCLGEGDWPYAVVNTNGSYTTIMDLPINQSSTVKYYNLHCGGPGTERMKTVTAKVTSPCPSIIQNQKLYREPSDGKIYVIENCVKRHIQNGDAFDKCHYNWGAPVENSTVSKYLPYVTEGSQVTVNTSCPPVDSGSKIVCRGDPWVNTISPNPANPGQTVTLGASQLSGCNRYDRVIFQVWDWSVMRYVWSPYCTLDNSTSCSTSFTAPSRPDKYPIRGGRDDNGDGSIQQGSINNSNGQPEWVDLIVKDPGIDPPYTKPLNCNITVINYFSSTHLAVDLGCTDRAVFNTEVKSVSKGRVLFNGTFGLSGYSCGYEVQIETYTSDGTRYVFRYCHLNGNISLPAQVNQGYPIGYADNSGYSFGSHLHLCVDKNRPLVPGYPDPTSLTNVNLNCKTLTAGYQIDLRGLINGI